MQKRLSMKVGDKLSMYKAFLLSLSVSVKLTDGEREVLACIMLYNDKKFDIDDDDRFGLIFSSKNKTKMSEELGISKNVLENRLSSLRKKNYLTKNNHLANVFNEKMEPPISINYIITIKEDE